MIGRGKKRSSNECERVAIAWSQAAHDPIMGHNQTGDTFDEKVYSLFSLNPPKEAEAGTNNECSHPSVMIYFQNNISPDVKTFIGVLQVVKGLGLTGVTIEEVIPIAVAVYLLKQKGEVLPKSNSAFYLLKSEDPDKWENFKAWNILKPTPKFQEPGGDTSAHSSETTEDEEEVEDPGLENSPPSKVNVEEQASSTEESGNNPNQDTEEDETMTNASSMDSYKPTDDSSTSVVNVVSHASRPKKHLSRDAAKANL